MALPLLSPGTSWSDEAPWPDLIDPPSVYATNGTLSVTMTAAPETIKIGQVTFPGTVFNGLYAAPVLHARPGDRLLIRLINHLNQPTNLHYHGIQTSPLGNSDNAFITVKPGESFAYNVKIPLTQPPGTYWYHSHLHGIVEGQVMGGLSGALIVDGFAGQFPELNGVNERLMVLKEYEWDDSENPYISDVLHERLQTINGQAGVTIHMRPHETQLWHIVSVAPNKIIHLSLPGHTFRVLGQDAVARNDELAATGLQITPGARFEVLVDAGEPGTYDLTSDKVLSGTALSRVLGHVVVDGEPAAPIAPITKFPARDDLRNLTVDTKRTVIFTQDSGSERFFIDGQLFDHARVDFRVPLGSVQEWTLVNKTGDFHEFHIHQLHFQVVALNGQPVPFDGLLDTVRIPEDGSVTIRLAFVKPEIVGKFFYHCHVLKHEDKGMMAAIEIYDPNVPAPKTETPKPVKSGLAPFRTWLARLTSPAGPTVDIPFSYCGL